MLLRSIGALEQNLWIKGYIPKIIFDAFPCKIWQPVDMTGFHYIPIQENVNIYSQLKFKELKTISRNSNLGC